jgi:hypothetical protein
MLCSYAALTKHDLAWGLQDYVKKGCTFIGLPIWLHLAPSSGSIWHYIVFHYQTPGFDCLFLLIDLDYHTIKINWVLLSIDLDYRECIIDSQLKYCS